MLNVALFGMTSKERRESNPEIAKNGNIRDYTDLLHLVILNNLQNTNAELIEEKVSHQLYHYKIKTIDFCNIIAYHFIMLYNENTII